MDNKKLISKRLDIEVPLLSDEVLVASGMTREEFESRYRNEVFGTSLIKRVIPDDGIIGDDWCVVIEMKQKDICGRYLYLSHGDGGSHSFRSLKDESMTGVVFFTRQKCLENVDYIRTQRQNRGVNPGFVVSAFNTYTGELI